MPLTAYFSLLETLSFFFLPAHSYSIFKDQAKCPFFHHDFPNLQGAKMKPLRL